MYLGLLVLVCLCWCWCGVEIAMSKGVWERRGGGVSWQFFVRSGVLDGFDFDGRTRQAQDGGTRIKQLYMGVESNN